MGLVYERLDFSKFETRLLCIHSVESDEDPDVSVIQCHLELISLLDHPEYHALSYSWGDPEITKAIMVNQEYHNVTVNLEAALRELRRQGIQKVWVDALCINQRDLYEKNNHVLQMGEIYARASVDTAWLGLSNGVPSDVCERSIRPFEGRNLSQLEIQNFFQRSFWKRKWIIQEVSKAKEVVFVCGQSNVDWTRFMRSVQTPDIQSSLSQEQKELLVALRDFRERESEARQMSLSVALIKSRLSQATEQRDTMYALLGLTSDGATIVRLPNYSQPVAEVSFEATRRMIEYQQRTATILLARGQVIRGDSSSRIPSWAPDWFNLPASIPPWITACVEHTGHVRDEIATISESMLQVFCNFGAQIKAVSTCLSKSDDKNVECEAAGTIPDDHLIDNLFQALTSGPIRDHKSGARKSAMPGYSRISEYHTAAQALEFAGLCSGDIPHDESGVREWVLRNGSLTVGSGSLESRLRSFYVHHKFVPWTRYLANSASTRGRVERALRDGLQRLSEFDMRIAFTLRNQKFARAIPVYREARVGDWICHLRNCSLLVLLRQEGDFWRFI